jgi:phosphatidylinositol-3-phosphatase
MRLAGVLILALVAAGCEPAAAAPPVGHVFVVVLENKDYAQTFGANTRAPYLVNTLAKRGQLLTRYYGIGHASLPNYVAMISGQGPNPQTQADCQRFTDFAAAPGLDADGQALGSGCVYPARVKTVADQLTARGLRWKGYMQDMGSPCRHPAVGAADGSQKARVGDQYATRHNPFVYFHSLIDGPDCARNDVPLDALPGDLASEARTPSLSFIVPDLCEDGHDEPCVDGRPGGLVSADAWLRRWVPRILGSAAFRHDGMLVVTFDEAENDASACCDEPVGPNTPNNGGAEPGRGGGRIGAVVVSPFVEPGSVNSTPYNHYALLRTIEDLFGLDHLGFAARPGLRAFGADVFGRSPAQAAPQAACPPAAREVSARARRGAMQVRPGGRATARLIDARGRVAAHRSVRGAFTWRPRVRPGVYELRVAAQRIGVRRSPSGFSVLGPFSARPACGALASASLGRPAFRRELRVRYRLREAATATITVSRAGRVVRRRSAAAAAGTHLLRIRGLRPGQYRVRVAAGSRHAMLSALRL